MDDRGPRVSVICCHTGSDKLAYLASSLDGQSLAAERVFLDNGDGRFPSAAAALNFGAREATGEWLLFCHQDVRFKDGDALRDLVALATSTLAPGDVGGVAGAARVDGQARFLTNITHAAEELPYPMGRLGHKAVEAETVDECVIVLPRATWEAHAFDERVCDGWHLYGVEQSLHALLAGHRVFVLDARVNHLSSAGTIDGSFYRALRRLAAAYGTRRSSVAATTGVWSLAHPSASIARRRLGTAVRRVLGEERPG